MLIGRLCIVEVSDRSVTPVTWKLPAERTSSEMNSLCGRDTQTKIGISNMVKIVQSEKDAFIGNLKAQLESWAKKIDSLRSDSAKVSDRERLEFVRQIDLLSAKQDFLEDTLRKLQSTEEENWQELKTAAERALHELWDAYDSAISKIGS